MEKRNYTLLKKGYDYAAVKNGVAWFAFIFTVIWLLVRLPLHWLFYCIIIAIYISTMDSYSMDYAVSNFWIQLLYGLFYFTQGNKFYVERLVRKKYKIIKKKVFAKSKDEAIEKITGRVPTQNFKGEYVYGKKNKRK